MSVMGSFETFAVGSADVRYAGASTILRHLTLKKMRQISWKVTPFSVTGVRNLRVYPNGTHIKRNGDRPSTVVRGPQFSDVCLHPTVDIPDDPRDSGHQRKLTAGAEEICDGQPDYDEQKDQRHGLAQCQEEGTTFFSRGRRP